MSDENVKLLQKKNRRASKSHESITIDTPASLSLSIIICLSWNGIATLMFMLPVFIGQEQWEVGTN